jgi:hypothetical protein
VSRERQFVHRNRSSISGHVAAAGVDQTLQVRVLLAPARLAPDQQAIAGAQRPVIRTLRRETNLLFRQAGLDLDG